MVFNRIFIERRRKVDWAILFLTLRSLDSRPIEVRVYLPLKHYHMLTFCERSSKWAVIDFQKHSNSYDCTRIDLV